MHVLTPHSSGRIKAAIMPRPALFLLALCLATLAPAQQFAVDNSGRIALNDYLNSVAAKETAARREAIARIATRAEAEARQREVRATILRLFSSLPERTPLNPRTTGSTHLEGFRVDKILFDSQPNFPVTGLLYIPDTTAETSHSFPAIVMAPGHSPTGKAGDVAFATAFARAGFVVLSYDPIGQGERLQYPDPANSGHTLAKAPTGEHGEAGLQPTLIGDSVARYFLWDGMRAVDYLLTRPEVDPHHIGAFGCSGGGTMTAMLAALDPRIATAGVACFTTSYDELLASIGPQDAEQSTPNFIASGLDFPDWAELAAPRPYAIIATTEDMFPFAGAKSTEAEVRRFYTFFHASDNLAFITGPGHHGNLRPILPQILAFFAAHLHPDAAFAKNLPPIVDPFVQPAPKPGTHPAFPPPPPASLVQVTPTGQVATSFPNTATVFTLNRARAAQIATPHPKPLAALQQAVRTVTHAEAVPGHTRNSVLKAATVDGVERGFLESGPVSLSYRLNADLSGSSKHPAILLLVPDIDRSNFLAEAANATAHCLDCAHQPALVLSFTPSPSPPGTEETKSTPLGPFYLTELRAELTGRTLLGLRVDDVIRAVDYLASRPDVDPGNITAETADPHLGLVLLHAAILDPRLKHVTVSNIRPSYRDLVNDPLPNDAPQDILPGVLRHYDIPDLVHALGPRLTLRNSPSGPETTP